MDEAAVEGRVECAAAVAAERTEPRERLAKLDAAAKQIGVCGLSAAVCADVRVDAGDGGIWFFLVIER